MTCFRYKKNIIYLLLMFPLLALAQQDPMFTQYMFDKMLINPAYVGSSNWIVGTVKHRSQLVGLVGGPSTQTFTFHMPIKSKNIGVGAKFINDKVGQFGRTQFTLNSSYHVKMRYAKLSFGLEAGVINQNINYQNLIRYDQIDNSIPGGDSKSMFDMSFGTYFQNEKFYTGLSAYHLLPNVSSTDFNRLNKHWFFIIGNVFDIVPKVISIDPSLLVKKVQGAKMQADFNANFVYKNRYTAGLAYRTSDALGIVFKMDITENIRFAYSYDINTNKLNKYSNGAHEFLLSYGVKVLPPPMLKDIHPRYYF